jgi:DNA-binding transcriptional LysR family regulator
LTNDNSWPWAVETLLPDDRKRIPNLNAPRAFEAAARLPHFRLAGEELLVTQRAIAQQVRRLEEELQTVLFERHARGLRLTDAGRRFHAALRAVFMLMATASEQIRPDRDEIRLSVPPTLNIPQSRIHYPANWLEIEAHPTAAACGGICCVSRSGSSGRSGALRERFQPG